LVDKVSAEKIASMLESAERVKLNKVHDLGPLLERYVAARRRKDEFAEAAEAAAREFREIESVVLPDAMEAAGTSMVRLDDGTVLELKEGITARIRKGEEEQALGWLREHGQGDMIRTEFKLNFGRGQLEYATEARKLLVQQNLEFSESENVPWNTLEKFVREELAANRPLPDGVAIHEFKKVEVKK
jgi:hypothetical protein